MRRHQSAPGAPDESRKHGSCTQPPDGASGVVIPQGGDHAGWAIYLLDGVSHYTHNFLGLNEYTVSEDQAVPEGTHQVRVEFDYDGGGVSKGGTATLFVDGD